MDFFEVVRQRRSIRRFAANPVKEEDLRLMLEAARLAPSAGNVQPWRFILIRDVELKEKLKDVVEASFAGQVEAAGEKLKEKLKQLHFYTTFFAQAPVVIAVATHPLPPEPPIVHLKRSRTFWRLHNSKFRGYYNPGLQSVGAAIAHLLLAATDLGYGGCWATLPLDFARQELEVLLEIKSPWFLVALVAVGVPAEAPPPRPRKPLEEIVSFR